MRISFILWSPKIRTSLVLLVLLCFGSRQLSAQWAAYNTSLTDSFASILFMNADNQIRITGTNSDNMELRADRADITIVKAAPSLFSVKTFQRGKDTFRLFDGKKEVATFVFTTQGLRFHATLNSLPEKASVSRELFRQEVLEATLVASSPLAKGMGKIESFKFIVINSDGAYRMECTNTIIPDEMKLKVLNSKGEPFVMMTDIRVKLENGDVVYFENYAAKVE